MMTHHSLQIYKDTLAEHYAKCTLPHMFLSHAIGDTTADSMPVGIWTRMVEIDTGLWVRRSTSLGQHAWQRRVFVGTHEAAPRT